MLRSSAVRRPPGPRCCARMLEPDDTCRTTLSDSTVGPHSPLSDPGPPPRYQTLLSDIPLSAVRTRCRTPSLLRSIRSASRMLRHLSIKARRRVCMCNYDQLIDLFMIQARARGARNFDGHYHDTGARSRCVSRLTVRALEDANTQIHVVRDELTVERPWRLKCNATGRTRRSSTAKHGHAFTPTPLLHTSRSKKKSSKE